MSLVKAIFSIKHYSIVPNLGDGGDKTGLIFEEHDQRKTIVIHSETAETEQVHFSDFTSPDMFIVDAEPEWRLGRG